MSCYSKQYKFCFKLMHVFGYNLPIPEKKGKNHSDRGINAGDKYKEGYCLICFFVDTRSSCCAYFARLWSL